MADQNAFNNEVLGRVADDYEAPHTIAGDLSRDLGRDVTEREVLGVLLSLAKSGLVQSYLYDRDTSRFVPVAFACAVAHESLWFMALK